MTIMFAVIMVYALNTLVCEDIRLACKGYCEMYRDGVKMSLPNVDDEDWDNGLFLYVDDNVKMLAVYNEKVESKIGGISIESPNAKWQANLKTTQCTSYKALGRDSVKNCDFQKNSCNATVETYWFKEGFNDSAWRYAQEVQSNIECKDRNTIYPCNNAMSDNAVWLWVGEPKNNWNISYLSDNDYLFNEEKAKLFKRKNEKKSYNKLDGLDVKSSKMYCRVKKLEPSGNYLLALILFVFASILLSTIIALPYYKKSLPQVKIKNVDIESDYQDSKNQNSEVLRPSKLRRWEEEAKSDYRKLKKYLIDKYSREAENRVDVKAEETSPKKQEIKKHINNLILMES